MNMVAALIGEDVSRLLLMRHGSTKSNSHKVVRSVNDVPLDENGHHQAIQRGRDMQDIPLNKIITSDMSRAHDTANVIAKMNSGNPEVIPTKKLRPVNWGNFTGKKVNDVKDQMNEYIRNPNRQIPGGQKVSDLHKNLNDIMSSAKNEDGNVLMVMHNSQFRALPHMLDKSKSVIQPELVKPAEVMELKDNKMRHVFGD